MIKEYEEEEFLLLSGIQHFIFCKRQWALIHIEQQWEENLRTVEGTIMHERAHGDFTEFRNGVKTVRDMAVHSRELGIYGVCDVVEIMENSVVPIEYKRGHPKESDADVMQLVLQAVCLEEMMIQPITHGFLYYGETRHRMQIDFSMQLYEKAREYTREMHAYYDRKHTPKVKVSKSCNACSLKDSCMPKLCGALSAKNYLQESIEGIFNEKTS